MAGHNNDEIKETSNNTTENSTELEETIQNETKEGQNDSLDEVESKETK